MPEPILFDNQIDRERIESRETRYIMFDQFTLSSPPADFHVDAHKLQQDWAVLAVVAGRHIRQPIVDRPPLSRFGKLVGDLSQLVPIVWRKEAAV
jgi:hypothetical protein